MNAREYLERLRIERQPCLMLQDLPYAGVIADVAERPARNRWTQTTVDRLTLTFKDGRMLPLERENLAAVIGAFGPETSGWIGRRLSVVVGRSARNRPRKIVRVED